MWNWWNGGQGYVTSNSNRGRPKNVKQTYKFKGNLLAIFSNRHMNTNKKGAHHFSKYMLTL